MSATNQLQYCASSSLGVIGTFYEDQYLKSSLSFLSNSAPSTDLFIMEARFHRSGTRVDVHLILTTPNPTSNAGVTSYNSGVFSIPDGYAPVRRMTFPVASRTNAEVYSVSIIYLDADGALILVPNASNTTFAANTSMAETVLTYYV